MFSDQICYLCLFIEELRLLILRVTIEQYILILVILFCGVLPDVFNLVIWSVYLFLSWVMFDLLSGPNYPFQCPLYDALNNYTSL